MQPDLITLDPDFIGTIAPVAPTDEFAEVQRVPEYKLSRREKIQKSGLKFPGEEGEDKPASAPAEADMEIGYSASDSSADEYEVVEEEEDGATGMKRTRKKKKKSALKAYQKKAGKNVVDPTVVSSISLSYCYKRLRTLPLTY